MTTSETAKVQAKLHQIETAIIERMAEKLGVHSSQMETDIKVIPELGEYYREIRAKIIKSYAAACAGKIAEAN